MAKFLWICDLGRPLSTDNLRIFRFTRVAFGVTSSPFILASTLNHHLKDYAEIRENFYVDNLLLDCVDPVSAQTKIKEAKEIMLRAGMRLREFVSPDPQALEGLSDDELLPGINNGEVRILGLQWRLTSDELVISTPSPTQGYTRRIILSHIASLFDPLGLCSPLLFKLKCFFQDLWDTRKGWNEVLDPPDRERWDQLMSQFAGQTITVPRMTRCGGLRRLVVFTDAGPDGFASTVYLVNSSANGTSSHLLFAKSRLRPRKLMGELTIPKLELLGICVGLECMEFVRVSLKQSVESLHLFSDSQIALSWVGGGNSTLPIFVANRVRETRSYASIQFHYVPRASNPADYGARGASASELMATHLWWHGPGWLCGPTDHWPDQWPIREWKSPSGELSCPVAQQPLPSIFLDPSAYSSWRVLLAVTKYVLCLVARKGGVALRRRMPYLADLLTLSPLSPEAHKITRNFIIKFVQLQLDGEDLVHTNRNREGLICLTTRLTNANGPEDFKNPIILPRSHWVTKLLILDSHYKLGHSGVDSTLCRFFSSYFCRRGRRLTKTLIKGCETCRRDRAARFKLPAMPPWPRSRVNVTRPFEVVGLDYLGPTIFKRKPGIEPGKAWILLFTCFSTRAVHLEVVDSLDTITFILAMRRFVARRGSPCEILSDNAAQLVLAREVVMKFNEIRWKLTPPLAPWAGGVYERLNQLIKNSFRRSLSRKVLPWSQLVTFTIEVEAILNNRPITFVSDEKDGPLALRPIDFILPRAKLEILGPEAGDDPLYRPSAAEKLESLWFSTVRSLQNFRDVWTRDYLHLLRQRITTTHPAPRSVSNDPPQVGHIVLVEMEDLSRNLWPLGRIVSLDPHRRTARLIMGNRKELVRPVCKLVPLEVMNEDPVMPQANQQRGEGNAAIRPPTREIAEDPSVGNAQGENGVAAVPPPGDDAGARKIRGGLRVN